MKLRPSLLMATVAISLMSCDRLGRDQDSNPDDEHGHEHGPGEDDHAEHAEHADEEEQSHAGDDDTHHDELGAEVVLSAAAVERSGIVLAPVTKRALHATLTAPARVSFDLEAIANIGALVPGRVIEIRVRVGDNVKAGDALLLLHSPTLGQAQIDLLHKRALLESTGPTIELARAAYERARSLFESQSGVTLTEVQDREATLRAAEAAANTAAADLRAATNSLMLLGFDQARMDDLLQTGQVDPVHTIAAPSSGEVITREVTVGEFVDNGHDSLLVVADLTNFWVLADVPEMYLARIAPDAGARIAVAGGPLTFEGHVSYVAPSIDAHTRAGQVRIVLPAGETTLKPGMFALADIDLADADSTNEVLAVPESAIQQIEGESVVFVPVPGEENTFTARPVVVGPPLERMREVFEGLEEGEIVVIAGSFILKAELGKSEAGHDHAH